MPSDTKTYQEETYIDNTIRLRGVLNTMPDFARDYFRAIEPTTSPKTRISYAYDIRLFFQFLIEENPVYKHHSIKDFQVQDLEAIQPVDIEEYLEYLKVYDTTDVHTKETKQVTKETKQVTNSERGLFRKMSALRSFYNYFFKRQIIQKNPTLFVDMPKLHDKAIIRLDTDEVAKLLDYVESCGSKLTGQALSYYNKTKERDIAIITLLLGTGIRVSELVGLDLSDVDFNNNGVMVTRKGGSQMVVYFGEEVEKALRNYLETYRKAVTPLAGYENALFLSTQKRRIRVQAVENMVKKYASQNTNKIITKHKQTGDIYLVADVLGHKDVNTTKKHYAAIDEDRRRSAANVVKLREP